MSRVLIKKVDDYSEVEDCLGEVIKNYLGGVNIDNVMLKPNLLAGSEPKRAISTHPLFVKSIAKIIEGEGIRVSVSDNPGVSGYGSSLREAKKAGLIDVLGDRFENPARSPERVRIDSVFTDSFIVSGNILRSGYLINLPKFKTHSLTLFSGAVKNMFGILIGGEKARAHSIAPSREEFAELLVDIYRIRTPDLTIMDAIWGMEGAGPSGGERREINRIIISDDGFAVDLACAKMMGLMPEDIPYLACAIKRGLIDPSSVEIEGDFEVLKDFRLPPTYLKATLVGNPFISFINGFIFENFLRGAARLRLDRRRCTRCYICVRQCPVGAMKKDSKGFPLIDKGICIGCYCCNEICPDLAWGYSGIMRLIGR